MQPFDRDLSIVVPVYNEEESLDALHVEITQALADTGIDYEVIYVDDGSKDRSVETIVRLHEHDERVVLVSFRRNFGQTAGFAAGFNVSSGRVVITLDADGQNDPIDIPVLMAKLDESGADVVNGWRVNRQDGFLLRKLPSKMANWIIARLSGVKLHDRGCSMRAFRSEVVHDLRLYGEMHRFIPEMVNNAGYTMVEVPVNHRPRVAGVSKYGISRTFRVLLDLVTVLFLRSYADRPMHFLGWIGIFSGGGGLGILSILGLRKLYLGFAEGWDAFYAYQIGSRPLFLLGILLIILGVQFLVTGLVAELVVRTYYESQNKTVYKVKTIIGKEMPKRHIE
ncbi:MAG: glycosyltransferase involved in cell wall biosynthesis [Cellvibrionaceae bacterium]|jgi:glycosyltransferase involved in cell wall biosynthesis